MRSKPKAIITLFLIIVMSALTIVPAFAASSDYKGKDTFIAGSNVQTMELIGAVSKYDVPYQNTIAGDNPSFFNSPQKSQTIVLGNSVIINSKIVFNNTILPTYEGDQTKEIIIPMYQFRPNTPFGESDAQSYCDAIKLKVTQPHVLEEENVELSYRTLDGIWRTVYRGHYYYSSTQGGYITEGGWDSQGYRTIFPKDGTGETPWTAEDDGIAYMQFLQANGTFTTYAGSSTGSNLSTSVFRRIWESQTTASKITNEKAVATTNYTMKAWWQANGEPFTIRFYGQNVVIDSTRGHEYPFMEEVPDVSWYAPVITYKVRYTYFFDNTNYEVSDPYEKHFEVYTGEKEIRGTWDDMALDNKLGAPLYPTMNQIFDSNMLSRVTGVIIDEYETNITFNHAMQSNFTLNITDYYYRGAERRAAEVAGYFDSFRRNFHTTTDLDFSDIGSYLSNAIGGFFDTPLFGSFSIGDITLAVIGIGLVVIFLKVFAGG